MKVFALLQKSENLLCMQDMPVLVGGVLSRTAMIKWSASVMLPVQSCIGS